MNRNTWAGIAACLVVATVVVLGFSVLGSPASQRLIRADSQTVRALEGLAEQIKTKWTSSNRVLPRSLETFSSSAKQDPVDGKSFSYSIKSETEYELCATFRTDNRNNPEVTTANPWIHPTGRYCFQLDASRPVPAAPYY